MEQFFAQNNFPTDFDNISRWRSVMAEMEHEETDVDSAQIVPETKSSRARQSSFFMQYVEGYGKNKKSC